MANVEQTQGQCRLCGKTFARAGMARHVRACRSKIAGSGAITGSGDTDGLLVALQDRYLVDYWLVVETAPAATWDDLDMFLRRIWVECCGHLSCFEVAGMTFTDDDEPEEWARNPVSKAQSITRALTVGSHFRYEYDFGTTTELSGRVLAAAAGGPARRPVEVLARNEALVHRCVGCGRDATVVCALCYQSVGNPCWYCDRCRGHHRCSDPGCDYFLPAVNSPRVGLCGYDGPADG